MDEAAVNLVGTTVAGRYRVRAPLGDGGFGRVFEGTDEQTGRRVAIKALQADLLDNREMRRRLEREATAAGFLRHPNIVEVLALDQLGDGTLALVMELVEGPSLATLLERGPVPPRRALVILRQALLGVAHAHANGMVHRDLKPDNIMIGRAGRPGAEYDQVKLVDFGLVKLLGDATGLDAEKLTRTGMVHGTPLYMAPEQALGRPVDGRTDLYALGIVLFEMLLGKPPFRDPDPTKVLRMHLKDPPPTLAMAAPHEPWATRPMDALLAGALAKAPEARFPDAPFMLKALELAFVSIDHIPN